MRGSRNAPDTSARFASLVRETYERLGAPDAFALEVPEGGHELFVELAVDFLRRRL